MYNEKTMCDAYFKNALKYALYANSVSLWFKFHEHDKVLFAKRPR